MADKRPDPAAEPGSEQAPAPAAAPAAWKAWLPLVVALVLSPVLAWALAEFVLLPRLRAATEGGAAGLAAADRGSSGHGAPAKANASTYRVENVVVNLAGTMGTRYLKASFTVGGSDPRLAGACEARKVQLLDATLGILGSLTLADLEEPGARNLLRTRLVTAYNEVLGAKLAEQIYFSEFVVQ